MCCLATNDLSDMSVVSRLSAVSVRLSVIQMEFDAFHSCGFSVPYYSTVGTCAWIISNSWKKC